MSDNTNQFDDQLRHMVREIQFGDEDDAIQSVKSALGPVIAQEARAQLQQQRAWQPYQQEQERSRQLMAKFLRDNSSVLRDVKSASAIRAQFLLEQRRDLLRLTRAGRFGDNYTEQQANAVTENDLANWHAQRRAERDPGVHPIERILEAAASEYERWAGVKLFRDGTSEQINARHMQRRKDEAAKVRGRERQPWEAVPEDNTQPSNAMAIEGQSGVRTPGQETAMWFGDMSGNVGEGGDDRYAAAFARQQDFRRRQQQVKRAREGGGA
jgi:hypothetical protein